MHIYIYTGSMYIHIGREKYVYPLPPACLETKLSLTRSKQKAYRAVVMIPESCSSKGKKALKQNGLGPLARTNNLHML